MYLVKPADAEEPDPLDPDQLRAPLPGLNLFGLEGRELLARLDPAAWRGNVAASLALIDDLDGQIDDANRQLKEGHAEHPYIPLLMSAPGWLGARLHDRRRDRRDLPLRLARQADRLHGPLPEGGSVGDSDRRGPLSKHGPTYLRWALIEATMHALRHPAYAERYQRTKPARPPARGHPQIEIARRLAHAISHMLTRNQEFAPRGAAFVCGLTALLDLRPRANIQFRLVLPPRRP